MLCELFSPLSYRLVTCYLCTPSSLGGGTLPNVTWCGGEEDHADYFLVQLSMNELVAVIQSRQEITG